MQEAILPWHHTANIWVSWFRSYCMIVEIFNISFGMIVFYQKTGNSARKYCFKSPFLLLPSETAKIRYVMHWLVTCWTFYFIFALWYYLNQFWKRGTESIYVIYIYIIYIYLHTYIYNWLNIYIYDCFLCLLFFRAEISQRSEF